MHLGTQSPHPFPSFNHPFLSFDHLASLFQLTAPSPSSLPDSSHAPSQPLHALAMESFFTTRKRASPSDGEVGQLACLGNKLLKLDGSLCSGDERVSPHSSFSSSSSSSSSQEVEALSSDQIIEQDMVELLSLLFDGASEFGAQETEAMAMERQSNGYIDVGKEKQAMGASASSSSSPLTWAGPTLLDIQTALAMKQQQKQKQKLKQQISSSLSSPSSDSFEEELKRGSSTMSTKEREIPSQTFNKWAWINQQKGKDLEPKHVVRIRSESEVVEDGYRWRKYGQKSIKNSPYPRSYYRCTSNKCGVKKQVERSIREPGIVIVKYEGLHLHHRPKDVKCNERVELVMEENEEVMVERDSISYSSPSPLPVFPFYGPSQFKLGLASLSPLQSSSSTASPPPHLVKSNFHHTFPIDGGLLHHVVNATSQLSNPLC